MRKFSLAVLLTTLVLTLSSCQTFDTTGLFNAPHSDSAITASVNDALLNSHQFSGIPVNVVTHKGNVTLSGYVKTIRQSDVAADLASKVDGVKVVENNLIVRK